MHEAEGTETKAGPFRPQPWERRSDESSKAWHAFTLYRDMGNRGMKRSLTAVHKKLAASDGEQPARATDSSELPVAETSEGMGNQTGDSPAEVSETKGSSLRQIETWSSRYQWVQRCLEWDRYLRRQIDLAHVAEIEEMAKKHTQISSACIAFQTRMLDHALKLLSSPDKYLEFQNLPTKTVLKLFRSSTRDLPKHMEAERRARGVRAVTPRGASPLGGGRVFEIRRPEPASVSSAAFEPQDDETSNE